MITLVEFNRKQTSLSFIEIVANIFVIHSSYVYDVVGDVDFKMVY